MVSSKSNRSDSLSRPSVSWPRSSSESVYWGLGGKHWIKSKSSNGSMIALEDGSKWEVSPLDRVYSIIWLPITDIIVTESGKPLYPYRLVNSDDDETVEAKLLSH